MPGRRHGRSVRTGTRDDRVNGLPRRRRSPIAGTGEQRAAGERLAHTAHRAAISRCVTEAGSSYPSVRFVDQHVGWVRETGAEDTRWLRALSPHPVKPRAQGLAVAQREVAGRMTRAPRVGAVRYEAALARCDLPYVYAERRWPVGQSALHAALHALVDEADQRTDDSAEAYAACTRRAGVRLADARDVLDRVQGLLPDPSEIPPPGSRDERWAAVEQEEARLAGIDVACRRDVHDLGLARLEPELRAFEREHAEQVRAVEQGWQEITRQAGELPRAR